MTIFSPTSFTRTFARISTLRMSSHRRSVAAVLGSRRIGEYDRTNQALRSERDSPEKRHSRHRGGDRFGRCVADGVQSVLHGVFRHPYSTYKILRDQPPSNRNPNLGFSALSRFLDLLEASVDHATYSSSKETVATPASRGSTPRRGERTGRTAFETLLSHRSNQPSAVWDNLSGNAANSERCCWNLPRS